MTYDLENNESSSSSGCSTPRLYSRRNALPHILQGCSIADLEGVYNSTEDIFGVLIPVPSPSKDVEESKTASGGMTPPEEGQRRMRERRNAVCFESVSRLLASGALRPDAQNSDCSDR